MLGPTSVTRAVALLVGVVLSVAACSSGRPTPAPSPPAAAATSTSSTPSAIGATRTGAGRPLLAVPDVRPAGFAAPPPGAGLARYASQHLNWQPCRRVLECTTVLVPLDYAHPDGPAITLALARRRATGAHRLGSLFINPGGPGGSGVSYVDYFTRAGLEDYDLVGWDPRGVGASTPVTCFGGPDLDRYYAHDISPDDTAEQQAAVQAERSLGASCLARSGPLLRHVSTEETVRDLDLLRGLVGDSRLTYFGSSYGTQIGAVYAQLFPRRVGRMVLDGAVNITNSRAVTQIQGFERALDHFASWCASGSCPLGRTQLEVLNRIHTFLNGLDEHPLAVPGGRSLSQQQGVASVIFPLYAGRNGWPVLRVGLVAAINRGDARLLVQLADQGNERRPDGSYGQIAYAFPAVRCLDEPDSSVPQAEREWHAVWRKAPVLGRLAGADLTCPSWPVPPARGLPTLTGAGAPPIVVVGTKGDPATPYEYAKAMATQLRSAVLVTFQGEGHLAYGQSGCVRQVVRRYLVDGHVPADGTRC